MTFQFEKTIKDFFKEQNVKNSDNFIVAFSGGSDSLSLLIALKKIGCKNVLPVYVNHNLRGDDELKSEINLNRENAKSLGYDLKIVTIDKNIIESGARKNSIGIEAEARRLRLEILEKEAKLYNNAYILTGHNKNDSLEWEIISYFRGRPSYGFIPERRDMYLRPLLKITHDETKEYCLENGFKFALDSTNDENEHLRNKVRNILIPKIEEIFPSFSKTFETRRSLFSFDDEKEIDVNKCTYLGIPCIETRVKDFENHSISKKCDAVLTAFSYFNKTTNGGRVSFSSVYDVLSLLYANTSKSLLLYDIYVCKTSYLLDEEHLIFIAKKDVDKKLKERDKNKIYVKEGIKIKINGCTKTSLKVLKDKKVPSFLRPLFLVDELL